MYEDEIRYRGYRTIGTTGIEIDGEPYITPSHPLYPKTELVHARRCYIGIWNNGATSKVLVYCLNDLDQT